MEVLKLQNLPLEEVKKDEDSGFGSPRVKTESKSSPKKKAKTNVKLRLKDSKISHSEESDKENDENEQEELPTELKEVQEGSLKISGSEETSLKKLSTKNKKKSRHLSQQLQLAKSASIENIKALPELKNKTTASLAPIEENNDSQSSISTPTPIGKIAGKEKEGFQPKKNIFSDNLPTENSPLNSPVDKFANWGKNMTKGKKSHSTNVISRSSLQRSNSFQIIPASTSSEITKEASVISSKVEPQVMLKKKIWIFD